MVRQGAKVVAARGLVSADGSRCPAVVDAPPAAMDTVVEMFAEDRLAKPHIPHVFAVPRLMTHLWRKALSKDADLCFSIRAGAPFWPKSMHEPLILFVMLPISYVPNYSGPWIMRGSEAAREMENKLEAGFKDPGEHGSRKFHDLASPLPCLWNGPERWSGNLLFEFLEKARRFPPVSRSMVRGMLRSTSGGPFPCSKVSGRRRRNRRPRDGGAVAQEVHGGKRRRLPNGDPLRM